MGNKLSQTRRDFLKRNVCRMMGLSLMPSFLRDEGSTKKKIIYRTLGRTRIKLPVLSMGASSDLSLTRAALDAGIMHIDTAYRYGAGRSEALIGEAIKGRPRESVVVATKVLGLRDKKTGLPPQDITPAEFKADFKEKVEKSLKRLQVDHLDFLYLHGVENTEIMALGMVKEALLQLQKEGKTRFLGVSFHHKELELIPAAIREEIYDIILTSCNFRQPHRAEVKGAIALAGKAGLGVIAMKVIAGYYWDKERQHPINAKAAIKWVLQDENVHTVVPAIVTFDQLRKHLSMMEDLTLTEEEKEDLRLGEKLGLAGLYCAQCGICRSRCRFGLDIPTAMRSYMYAYGYKNPTKAKETLLQEPEKDFTCRRCDSCAVTCSMGFDVCAKIQDVIRILDVPDDFLG